MTEYARLKTKLKNIVTGKYKSPAKVRTNFAYEEHAVEPNSNFNNQSLAGPPTLQQTQDKLKSLNTFSPSTNPIVNKMRAIEIMANTPKNPVLQSNATASQTTDNSAQYEEKYKHTPKTYEGYMKHAPYVAEEEKAWLKKQAEAVATADDYRKEAEKSKADLVHLDSLYNDAMRNFTQEDDAIDKKITGKEKEFASFQEKAEQKEYESRTKDILKNDVKARTIIEQYYRLQNESIETDTYTQMMNGGKTDSVYTSDEEKRIIQNFNNLAQKGYNPEELYNYYKRQKEAEASSYAIESLKKEAKERPVAMSAWSTIDNAVGSIGDAGKYIGAGVTEFVTGEKQYIDTNDTAAARTQAIRGAVSEKIGENIDDETASGVAQFLYQTGMSMADFLVTLPLNFIPGIGQGLQLAVLSTSAGTSAAKEAYDNTGKASNALSTGLVAGIAEALLEKVSIDELFKIFNSKDATTVVNILKNAAKQSGVEATEEGLTNIINTAADGLINSDKSAFSLEYQEYISQGLSEDEAMQKCIASLAKQLALDAAGGALSGGVIGGGASTINYAGIKIDTKRESQEIGKEYMAREDFDVNALLSEAKASSNKKAVSIANAIEKQMKKNVNYKVEAVDVGNLVKLVATSPKAATTTETEMNQPEPQNVETNVQKNTEEVKSYGFGEQHPNGVNAVDSKGNQLVIRRIESSARVYGEADNRVKVMTTDGKIIDADELTFNLPQYNELASAAKSFDTNGARALVAYYESYADYKEHKTNMQEYLEGFTKLYDAGRMGGTWENVKNHRSYAGYINSIGLTAAINAVYSGGNDSNIALQNEANKLVRVETREGRVYVEPNAEEDLQVDETAMQVLELLSKKTGREIILTNELGDHENGRFQGGKVYISTNLNQNYVLPVAIHECVHGIRKDSPADYAVIKGFVIDYLFANGHNVEHMVDDIKAKWGNKVPSYEDCIEEIVCNAMMSIATDENSMQKALKVAHANENILDKIAQAFNNLVAKIKEYLFKFRDNKAAKIFAKDVETLEQLAEMFNEAAENAKATTGENNGSKSLMAGEKAKIVNYSNLATAKEMKNNGADSETIRQNTGWFKGYDGKWRFEIDDSEIEIATNGRFSRNPDISRYAELIDKVYFKNDFTSEEESELRELDKKLEGKSVEPEFLGDLIKHDKLFEVYPQLKEISVYFAKNTKGEMAAYHPGFKEIALEQKLKLNPEKLKSTLIHEIQHAIQDIEEFSEGSNIEYWDNADVSKRNGRSSYELYKSTAGEVEARDASKRMNLTAEQRKNTRPDIDRTDVVFAEDSGIKYSMDDVIDSFGIKNINDYVHVQRQVYKTLVEEGFFTDIGNRCRIVRNINSKMSIEINKSGIDETFNNKNFSNNSKNLKLLKLAIFRKLPQIIENGILIKDNVPSYHKNNSTLSFAYIEDKVYIGDSIATVKVTVRKSYQKNKFWVHHVYIENGNGSTSAGTSKSSITAYTTSIANNMIQQSKSDVNTENIEDVSDVKFSIDDSFNDWLDDAVPQGIDFDKVLEINPTVALATVYRSAAKTTESGLAHSKGVDLDDKAFLSIARKVMQRYEIKHKNNPEYAQELAELLKKFTKTVENGEYDNFAEFFEEFVDECRGGILLSENYDKALLKEERESILSLLVGKNLIIRNRDISSVEEKYGSISNYRKLLYGRLNIGIEKNSNSDSFYIKDILDYVKDNYPYLVTTEDYNDKGYIWLEKLINNVLMPKYENKEISFYENPETAAIEMAFSCATEIIDAKANNLVLNEKADKNQIKELAKARSDAKKYIRDITKAKRKQYQHLFKSAEKRVYRTENIVRRDQLKIAREVIKTDRGIKKRLRERVKNLNDENKKQKAIIDSGMRTIREEYNEGREKTKYIHSLGRMLDRLSKRLDGKAKNGEYIPDALKKPILEVLGSFTAQPVSLADGKKRATPGYFGEWKHLAEIGERVQDLENAYKTLEKDEKVSTDLKYSFIDVENLSYKKEVMEDLSRLRGLLKGHNIYTLGSNELREIYETMSFLERSLKEAVEIILDGQKENISKLAEDAIWDVNVVYFKKDVDNFDDVTKNIRASVPREIRNSFIATHLDPVRYGKFLSGYKQNSIVYKLFSDLHKGDVKRTKIMQNAFTPVQKVLNRYTEQMRGLQRDDVTDFNFFDLGTRKRVKISQATLIAIYLTDRQTAGHRHLLGYDDGEAYHYTVLPDLDYMNSKKSAVIENILPRGKEKEKQHRVRFNESDLQKIAKYVEGNKMLIQIANAVSSVYNEYLNQQINEVSMAKYGMKIATVKDYYPIRTYSDGSKYGKNFEAEFYNNRLKDRGFTKQRETSYSPIMINDVLESFSVQVQVVSEYCGLLIPIENFKKVYNSGDGTYTLHEAILDKFGQSAVHYIDKLMGDLQKPADNIDTTFIDRAQRNFMGAKIIANPGAMLKQFAAYPLANRYFGSANVAKAFASGTRKVDLEKYSEYTPYLWYRKDGNGTVVGEVSREHGLARKGLDWFDFVGKMDNRVVGSLLYAAELHVEQTTNLKKGSDDFYREVVRRFEKCIDETQPNNMVTSKPQYLRNKSLKLLSLSAFRSQNMAIGNTMLDSFMEFSTRQHEYKFKSNEETKAARDAAAKKFASCCIAACESSIMIGILTVAINMLLWHKRDKYKDEEGNISPEKIFWNFISETFNSLSGTFAFGDYLYQAIESVITGDNLYGLQVMGVENISNAISNAIEGDWWSVIMLLGDCFGIPADNLYRMGKSIYLYGKNAIYGPVFDDKGNLDTTHLNFYILEAKKNGDTGRAELYEKMWKEVLVNEQGKTEGEAVEYIKDKLVIALATDDNVEDAAVAKANGELDAYEGYRQKAVDYGFDSKDVQRAIDKSLKNIISEIEANGLEDEAEIKSQLIEEGFNKKGAEYVLRQMRKSEKESTLTSSFEETSEEDELVMYDYSDAFEALISGDSDSYEQIESYLIEQGGKKKSEIKSAMRSASRTDKLWEEYIYVSSPEGDDLQRTKELVEQLTRIYGTWGQATIARRKYEKRIAEQEE